MGRLSRGAARDGARIGGGELLRSAELHLSVRRIHLRRRRGRRYRNDKNPPFLRAGRLRHAYQPDDHRGPGARWLDGSVWHRHGPGDPLRPRRQRHDRFVHGLFPADRGGNAEMGDRLDDDALAASSDWRQGRRREPECRWRAVLLERGERRFQIPGFDPYTNAARPLANLGGGGQAWSASVNRNDISDRLAAVGYVADRDIATALWLMEYLKRPLLLEGEAGVGKTEVAKSLAAVHQAELIRLQCYEGLDQNAALYEWNYQRQLLAIKTREGVGESADAIEEHIFSERYLLERPLLAAIRRKKPPVLLVDEVDRADEEFEAFLLEL